MKIQPEEQYKFLKISLPDGVSANEHSVLLHACCAPCSAAIVECMLRNGIRPTVYFSNSNIYPQQEFDIRKHELIRFLQQQDVPYVEDEYDHADWKKAIAGLENEPERGSRCSVCFQYRLHHAACYAQANGFKWLTTTLASLEEHPTDRYSGNGGSERLSRRGMVESELAKRWFTIKAQRAAAPQ